MRQYQRLAPTLQLDSNTTMRSVTTARWMQLRASQGLRTHTRATTKRAVRIPKATTTLNLKRTTHEHGIQIQTQNTAGKGTEELKQIQSHEYGHTSEDEHYIC